MKTPEQLIEDNFVELADTSPELIASIQADALPFVRGCSTAESLAYGFLRGVTWQQKREARKRRKEKV